MDTPYTLVQDQADRMNVVVLGRFLEKHPDCDIARQEYNRAKAQVEYVQKQQRKHVRGTQQCLARSKGLKHFAVQTGIQPTYRCLYCCADMS